MRKLCLAVLLAVFWGSALASRAAIVSFDYSFEFSGGTPPAGSAPWLRVTFDDGGGSGSVNMKFEAVNLVASEFVRFTYFNLDPALNPNSLIFSAPVKTGVFADPVISTGVNAFQADGDGLFDIQIQFDQSPPVNRFDGTDKVEYTITGIPTLTANSFNFLSGPAGGHGPFPVAAHVQGIGPGGQFSGWVTVPEPASLGLILLGLIPLTRIARRFC